MNCKLCGCLIEDTENISTCPQCGNSLVEETVVTEVSDEVSENEALPSEEENEELLVEESDMSNSNETKPTSKKTKNGIILAIVGLVMVACIVFVGVMMKKNKVDADDTTKDAANTTNDAANTTNDAADEETALGDYSRYDQYIKEIGEYKGVEVSMVPAEVTDEQVEQRISSILVQATTLEEIKDRTDVQNGDIAIIDYTGYMDGEAFEGGSATDAELVIGSGQFIEGFETGLVGKKVGDKVTLDLSFPDPYENNPDFAGKPVKFEVTINSINKEVVPELTQEWVENNSESKSIDDYKKTIRTALESEAAQDMQDTKTARILEAIMEKSTIDSYPQEEIDGYVDYMKSYYEYLVSYYGTTLEEYVTVCGFTLDSFEEYLVENAKKSVAAQMICFGIATKEGMTITDDEYQTGALEFAQQNGFTTVEELEAQSSKSNIYDQLIIKKVTDMLTENAVEVLE